MLYLRRVEIVVDSCSLPMSLVAFLRIRAVLLALAATLSMGAAAKARANYSIAG